MGSEGGWRGTYVPGDGVGLAGRNDLSEAGLGDGVSAWRETDGSGVCRGQAGASGREESSKGETHFSDSIDVDGIFGRTE